MDRNEIAQAMARLRIDDENFVGRSDALSGRVSRVRAFNQIVFIELLVQGRLAQVAARREQDPTPFATLSSVQAGDWVLARGLWGHTQSGDRALFAAEVDVLAHVATPFPPWFNPVGAEVAMRRPEFSMASNPDHLARVRFRFELMANVRQYLTSDRFLEVATPVLSSGASGASATPFSSHCEALGESLSMRVAPENQLVRLLASGLDRIYEMGPAFRNEGLSVRHNPEFWLLEAYAVGETMEDGMHHVDTIVRRAFEASDRTLPEARVFSIVEALMELGGLTQEQAVNSEYLTGVLTSHGHQPEDSLLLLQWQWFDQLCPIPQDPFFIVGHPVAISPLAASTANDPLVARRYEYYVSGMELGNGYEQVRTLDEQRTRFAEQAARQGRGHEAMANDEAYLQMMELGLPLLSGFGIGIDRLAQVATGSRSIRDVLPFPLTRTLEQ